MRSDDPRFGGLSGLAVTAEGGVLAVSDKGFFVDFELDEAPDGTLRGARKLRIEPMRDERGAVLERPRERDAEELVLLPGGRRLVIFERHVRLGYFPPGSARAERFVELPGLVPGNNRDIEAMVPLDDDRLLLIAERDGTERGVRHAWIGRPGAWERLDYVSEQGLDVAGAALLPGGDLLVLERGFSTAFRTRVTRVPGASLRPGAMLRGREVLRLYAPLLTENFEGIAARTKRGRVAIYLVSDDNYFALQRTLLVKFELADSVSSEKRD